MKYFSYDKSYDENRKMFLLLCNKYHPDKPTGNEEVMKAINNEWELYKKTYNNKTEIDSNYIEINISNIFWQFLHEYDLDDESEEKEYITFKGRKFLLDENILQTIALRYGGLGLLEFVSSKEWQNHLNK